MRNSTAHIDIPLHMYACEHYSCTCVAGVGDNTSVFLSQWSLLVATQIRKVDSTAVEVAAGEIQRSAVA